MRSHRLGSESGSSTVDPTATGSVIPGDSAVMTQMELHVVRLEDAETALERQLVAKRAELGRAEKELVCAGLGIRSFVRTSA